MLTKRLTRSYPKCACNCTSDGTESSDVLYETNVAFIARRFTVVLSSLFSKKIWVATWNLYMATFQLDDEPNSYMGNGCLNKHPLKSGCLGFQVQIDQIWQTQMVTLILTNDYVGYRLDLPSSGRLILVTLPPIITAISILFDMICNTAYYRDPGFVSCSPHGIFYVFLFKIIIIIIIIIILLLLLPFKYAAIFRLHDCGAFE